MPVVSLSQIHTLRQFYNNGVLTAAKPDKVRYKSAGNFLDRVSLYQGDICQLELDAIVNAANRSLLGGGGVDGAIHKAAGPELVEECETLNGCQTGDAKITKGYNLPSKHVIHAVGPIYSTRLVDEVTPQLASCYKRSLQIAVENELKHVAFPSISTGIYGYPIEDATHVALEEGRRFLETSEGEALDRVVFVVWSDTDKSVYESLIPLYFPPEERRS